jgi:hypothetical protein
MNAGLLLEQNSNAIQNQTFLCLFIVCFVASFCLMKKLGVMGGLFFGWAMSNGCWVSCYGTSPYQFDLSRYYVFGHTCMRYMLMIISVALTVSMIRKTEWLTKMVMVIVLANSVLLLSRTSGLFYCDSIDASFGAITFPLFLARHRAWKAMSALVVASIAVSGSSAAFLGLMLSTLIYLRNYRLIPYGLAMGGVAYELIPHHHALFYSNGRIELWKSAWAFFKEHHDWHWIGSGLGTYAYFEPEFRSVNGVYQRWLFTHNDPAEIGWTLGGIGFGLFALTYGVTVLRSRFKPDRFASLITFGFCMMTQPLLHNYVATLLAAIFVRESCENT